MGCFLPIRITEPSNWNLAWVLVDLGDTSVAALWCEVWRTLVAMSTNKTSTAASLQIFIQIITK